MMLIAVFMKRILLFSASVQDCHSLMSFVNARSTAAGFMAMCHSFTRLVNACVYLWLVISYMAVDILLCRCVYEPCIITTSCLDHSAKRTVRQQTWMLGAHVISEWSSDCTLVVMTSLSVTVKVMLCLTITGISMGSNPRFGGIISVRNINVYALRLISQTDIE